MSNTNFDGFGKDALPFLKALEFHQDRNWFKENRAIYDIQLVEPFLTLLLDVSERLAKSDINLVSQGKTSMFRINRDVRFSKDKKPYNCRISGVLTRTGTKKDTGGIYMHFEPGKCFLASGLWYPPGPKIKAMREQIVARQKDFLDICEKLEDAGLAIGADDMVSRTPLGFKHVVDENLLFWLKHKSYVVHHAVDEKIIHSPKLVDEIEKFGKLSLPLMNFIWRAVDPLREETRSA